jgi:hypothetical protein
MSILLQTNTIAFSQINDDDMCQRNFKACPSRGLSSGRRESRVERTSIRGGRIDRKGRRREIENEHRSHSASKKAT